LLADFGISCDAPTPHICHNTRAMQITNAPMKQELSILVLKPSSLTLIVMIKQLIFSMFPQNCKWQIFPLKAQT